MIGGDRKLLIQEKKLELQQDLKEARVAKSLKAIQCKFFCTFFIEIFFSS